MISDISLRFVNEQCTPATEQWKRILSTVGTAQRPPSYRTDPSLGRLLSGLQSTDCDNDDASIAVGFTPWKTQHKVYSLGLVGLNEEIEDFVDYMRPLPEEKRMRQDVIERVSCLVTELWPTAKVEVFGSTATGLFLPTSDIDLVICWDLDSQPDVMQSALLALEKQIINKGVYDDVKVLKTSVPIVKFTDRQTAVKVDIGFKTTISTGPQSVQFIQEKMCEFVQLEYLVLVLKQFLVFHNLLESFNGGISSYCLILLIISYLQMSSKSAECRVNSLAQNLVQFLELYGCQFNYLRTGIRVTDGGSYFSKNTGHSDNNSYQQYSLLCIEDPLKAQNDVGRGCYGAMKVRDAFADAFRELRDAVLPQYERIQPQHGSILGRILRIPLHIVQYRSHCYRLNTALLHQPTAVCVDPAAALQHAISLPSHTTQSTTSDNQQLTSDSRSDSSFSSESCTDTESEENERISSHGTADDVNSCGH